MQEAVNSDNEKKKKAEETTKGLQAEVARQDMEHESETAAMQELRRQLEAERAKVEAKDKELEEERAKREHADEELKKERAKRVRRSLKKIYIDGCELEVQHIGGSNSNTNTGHVKANARENDDFPIEPIFNEEEQFLDDLLEESSVVLARPDNGKAYCVSEADVQDLVSQAVTDAVTICNVFFAKRSNSAYKLRSHREVGLFTNRPDHTVVVDRTSGLPVFICETKLPLKEGKLTDKKQVNGQLFDYLSAMKAFGHRSPFGAMTSLEETYLACLPDNDSTSILKKRSEDIINDAVQSVVKEGRQPTTPNALQSKPLESCTQTTRAKPIFDASQSRELLVSTRIEAKRLVSSLVNGIFLGLNGFTATPSVPLLVEDTWISVHALRLDQKDYKWGNLKVKIKNQYKKKSWDFGSEPLFVVGFLGAGSTSRVYRAVTKKGEHCVVKMYIRNYDESSNQPLSPAVFQKEAKEAIEGEKNLTCTLYTKSFTCIRVLNSFQCLVRPYYEPIPNSERLRRLGDVRAHLCDMAKKIEKKYKESDMAWRHIGLCDGEIRCIDLGDLVDLGNETADDYADRHCKVLEARHEE